VLVFLVPRNRHEGLDPLFDRHRVVRHIGDSLGVPIWSDPVADHRTQRRCRRVPFRQPFFQVTVAQLTERDHPALLLISARTVPSERRHCEDGQAACEARRTRLLLRDQQLWLQHQSPAHGPRSQVHSRRAVDDSTETWGADQDRSARLGEAGYPTSRGGPNCFCSGTDCWL